MSWIDSLKRVFAGAASEEPRRWVVLDVETSGLDLQRDRLLAIAALALDMSSASPRIVLGDSFEILLRQDEQGLAMDEDTRFNILLHGIGLGAQRGGVDPVLALQAFEQWVGDAPLIAFHAAFDEGMIQREMARLLGRRLKNPWLDLEPVAALTHPQAGCRSLDDWMAHFGIRCAQRHQAAADTMATAELLLCLWPALVTRRETRFAALMRMSSQRRWLQA